MSILREKKMARNVRFSFKRFIFHNKIVIFLTVLVIIVFLFIHIKTKNTQSQYRNHFRASNRLQPPYSKAELDAYYKLILGISLSNTATITNDNANCENVWTIAAIPGIDIEDYVWEYISLMAINELYGQKEGRKINTFLARRSIEDLERFFERIRFTDLGTMPDRCYRLHEAILVENGNNFYFNADLETRSMFLLGEGERRYREIAQIYGRKYEEYFRINDLYQRIASYEIATFRADVEELTGASVATDSPITGMYIRSLELPSAYYERAMDFLRKIHRDALFLVICPSYLLEECRNRFSAEDTIVKVHQEMLEMELAVMASCDHLIIENEFGILAALLNENNGNVVVYDQMHAEIAWFSKYMTENFENWYSIA